ncbi:MAG: hypothetical protein QNK05_09670 [Myxococcota bacterium]|nr:hypothetical protein [Myxococcota bacterium]
MLTSVHITLSGTSESDSCRCRVHIRLRDGESRTVDESASSLGEAADRVIWRLDHHLLRRSKANTARLDVARMPTRTLDRRSR